MNQRDIADQWERIGLRPMPPRRNGMGADEAPKPSLLDSPILPKAAMVFAAYHGLRRNNGSLLWGAIWGLGGHLFPLLVPALAIGQGWATQRKCP